MKTFMLVLVLICHVQIAVARDKRIVTGAAAQFAPFTAPGYPRTINDKLMALSEADMREQFAQQVKKMKAWWKEMPAKGQQQLAHAFGDDFIPKSETGKSTGIHMQWKGDLHGPSMSLDEDGLVTSLAIYDKGKRDGPLRIWVKRSPRLYVEYAKGQKSGLLCYYRDGLPLFMQRWKNNQIADFWMIARSTDGKLQGITADKLTPDQQGEIIDIREDIERLEEEFTSSEKQCNKVLGIWYRKEDESRKSARAVKLGPIKRAQTSERNKKRAADSAKETNQILQRGLRGGL